MKVACNVLANRALALNFILFATTAAGNEGSYGVDVSFPIHHDISNNFDSLPHNMDHTYPVPAEYEDMPVQVLGDKKTFYESFLDGCRQYYGKKAYACDQTEKDRLAMSVRQPQSMQNYTDTGFKKIRAPSALRKLLTEHWEKNKDIQKKEEWPTGNTYTNHWAAPTYMVSVEDTGLRGGGRALRQRIWDAAQDAVEEWTGMELTATSQYGIRVYTEGAVLAPHVDRMPLVSSCIVNVAQDVDEDWPLEVYGRDGKAYNVTMQPGDMVLYESHSLIHGRPFPLKGRYYANIFIHFEPTGRPLRNVDQVQRAVARDDSELPPYILRGSPEEENWKRSHPSGWQRPAPAAAAVPLPEAAMAAATGDLRTLTTLAAEKKHLLHKKDKNGWQPIHEAARGGHKEVVELLLHHGADVNERTHHGTGPTPLHLALESHGEKHPIVAFLRSVGAANIGMEL